MIEDIGQYREISLSTAIDIVQKALPFWLILSVHALDDENSEPFHLKLNNAFIPLDYNEPSEAINDLIDLLHHHAEYDPQSAAFSKPRAFSTKDYVKLDASILQEIEANLRSIRATIFISNKEWYAELPFSGPVYPLKNAVASEFFAFLAREQKEEDF